MVNLNFYTYWRLILIECLRYWLLHALALSCRPRGGCTRSAIWVDYASENRIPQSEYPMYVNFPYNSKDNKNTMQVYLVTAMTHVIALEAGPSSQGALKPITPVQLITNIVIYFQKDTLSFYHLTCICHPTCIFPPLLGDRDIKANIPPPPIHNSARVAICECLACYVNHSNSIFKSLNNVFHVINKNILGIVLLFKSYISYY